MRLYEVSTRTPNRHGTPSGQNSSHVTEIRRWIDHVASWVDSRLALELPFSLVGKKPMIIRRTCPLLSSTRPLQLLGRRFYFSSDIGIKAFSQTLLLPRTALPLWPNRSRSEEPFRERTTEELYRWQVCLSWKNMSGLVAEFSFSGNIKKDPCLYCMMDRPMPMATCTWVCVSFIKSVIY